MHIVALACWESDMSELGENKPALGETHIVRLHDFGLEQVLKPPYTLVNIYIHVHTHMYICTQAYSKVCTV